MIITINESIEGMPTEFEDGFELTLYLFEIYGDKIIEQFDVASSI